MKVTTAGRVMLRDLFVTVIGRQIWAICEQKGIAQEEFAAEAGIDRPHGGTV
jgi:hypothetical protein